MSKLEELQKSRPTVHCDEKSLDNVFRFLYLGTVFEENGLQCYDVDVRVAMTMSRCGKLCHIFDSPHIPLKRKSSSDCMKRRFVRSSHLTYGCETWDLDTITTRKINGANSVMLARITGRPIPSEARPSTTSLNLIKKIRERRLCWLGHGHIIRADPNSVMYYVSNTHHTTYHGTLRQPFNGCPSQNSHST